MNTSSVPTKAPCLQNEDFLSTIMAPAITVIFILAAGFNSFSLWILCFQVKKKTPIDILMLNLCVGDLLFSFTSPFLIIYYSHNHWIFGSFMCKLQVFFTSGCVLASLFFLACISSYRCYMITKPIQFQHRITKKRTIAISIIIWLLACGFSSPSFYMINNFEMNGKLYCLSFNEPHVSRILLPSGIILFVVGCAIPFGFLLVSTILMQRELANSALTSQSQQRNQHAVKMMVFVLFVFIICFFPLAVGHFLIATVDRNNCLLFQRAGMVYYSSLLCTHINGVLDPIVYYFASTKYRSMVIKVMKSWKCFKKPVAASRDLNVNE
ncbi:proteinase-activated receptor 2-like [Carcharodon carcharias]|uniref:proteinase-activated receptor 2-like n=1 Tax=Carcharodon carcharias TaxID=13397 RepID=UPI001B7F60F1|nr:proteinase-activated receptor 2-like [Carcharodon carcharias]